MKKQIHNVPLRSLAGKATLGLALSAGAMSLVSAWLLPLSGLWLSLAWASVGCAACLWAGIVLADRTASIGDVIARVEAESPGALRAPAKRVQRGATP